jgi:hypothetical protein
MNGFEVLDWLREQGKGFDEITLRIHPVGEHNWVSVKGHKTLAIVDGDGVAAGFIPSTFLYESAPVPELDDDGLPMDALAGCFERLQNDLKSLTENKIVLKDRWEAEGSDVESK